MEERTSELKKTQQKLIASERLAALGQFAGSIAHEIRNPLGVISSSAYFLKRWIGEGDEKVQTHITQIKEQVDNCAEIIRSILNLTRLEAPRIASLNLLEAVRAVTVPAALPGNINVNRHEPDGPMTIKGDKAQLLLLFNNIVKNAVQGMPDGGTLTVSVDTVNGEGGTWAEVRFSDTGPRIEPEHQGQIFEPLFTTKTHGVGFGLAIVKLIVDRHNGRISVESTPGEGATFIIHLPALRNQ